MANFTDGTSKTLMAAEVKAYMSTLGKVNRATVPAIPTDATTIATLFTGTPKMGTALQSNTGHTEWGDGRITEGGFTTTFTPNTLVPYTYSLALGGDGNEYDIDFSNASEGSSLTVPTFAAVTARSYHPGLVNTVYMDGSVHTITNTIDIATWQALSTRSGGEEVQSDY
jgi:prepilin-type processing-associated H-X9-DG protein